MYITPPVRSHPRAPPILPPPLPFFLSSLVLGGFPVPAHPAGILPAPVASLSLSLSLSLSRVCRDPFRSCRRISGNTISSASPTGARTRDIRFPYPGFSFPSVPSSVRRPSSPRCARARICPWWIFPNLKWSVKIGAHSPNSPLVVRVGVIHARLRAGRSFRQRARCFT